MNRALPFLGVVVLALSSCSSEALFRADQNTPNGWRLDDTVSFQVNQPLGESSNFYLHLRNNQDYPFSNIFLVVNVKAQDSIIESDTLEYAMAKPNGEWLGSGFSSVKESKLWWKEQWSTAADPPYTVEIAQANRTNGREQGEAILPGIVSVGLSITSAEN